MFDIKSELLSPFSTSSELDVTSGMDYTSGLETTSGLHVTSGVDSTSGDPIPSSSYSSRSLDINGNAMDSANRNVMEVSSADSSVCPSNLHGNSSANQSVSSGSRGFESANQERAGDDVDIMAADNEDIHNANNNNNNGVTIDNEQENEDYEDEDEEDEENVWRPW